VEHNHNRTTAGRYNINKTTQTRWWRIQRAAGANVTKRAERVEHNHNRTTAGRYNINKTKPTRWWRKRRRAGAKQRDELNITTIEQQQAATI
jgi:hypothetical protein